MLNSKNLDMMNKFIRKNLSRKKEQLLTTMPKNYNKIQKRLMKPDGHMFNKKSNKLVIKDKQRNKEHKTDIKINNKD